MGLATGLLLAAAIGSVEVAYDRSGAPPSCRPAAVAGLLTRLGETGSASRRLFARRPAFRWYSMAVGRGLKRLHHNVARSPAAAVRLLRRRAAAGERSLLVAADLGYSPRRNRADVTVVFTYSARDTAGGSVAGGVGKAIVD